MQPPHSTLMGILPTDRVKVHSPHSQLLAWICLNPFILSTVETNQVKPGELYIFTCATSRAVHLEIVENASAEAFLQALR